MAKTVSSEMPIKKLDMLNCLIIRPSIMNYDLFSGGLVTSMGRRPAARIKDSFSVIVGLPHLYNRRAIAKPDRLRCLISLTRGNLRCSPPRKLPREGEVSKSRADLRHILPLMVAGR